MPRTAWRFQRQPMAREQANTLFSRSSWAQDAAAEFPLMAAYTAARTESRANGDTIRCRGCDLRRFPVPRAIPGRADAWRHGFPGPAWQATISARRVFP